MKQLKKHSTGALVPNIAKFPEQVIFKTPLCAPEGGGKLGSVVTLVNNNFVGARAKSFR